MNDINYLKAFVFVLLGLVVGFAIVANGAINAAVDDANEVRKELHECKYPKEVLDAPLLNMSQFEHVGLYNP